MNTNREAMNTTMRTFRFSPLGGDIGEPVRHIELEPAEPSRREAPAPAPAPTPVREPEKVPA